MRKNFNKRLALLLTIVSVLIASVVVCFPNVSVAFAEELVPYSFDDYTDSCLSISDSQFSLENYKNDYFGNSISGFPYQITTDSGSTKKIVAKVSSMLNLICVTSLA